MTFLVLLSFAFSLPVRALDERPAAPLELTTISIAGGVELAADEENYFAVWSDLRETGRRAVYGARITPDREVLDPVGVRLFAHAEAADMDVAYGDGHYLVVSASLQFAVVDREANVVVRGKVADEVSDAVEVFYNGGEFVVFWGTDQVRSATLGRDGRLLSGPRTVVSRAQGLRLHSVASNGERILVTYSYGFTLFLAITTIMGEALAANIGLIAQISDPSSSSIASARGTFVVTWRQYDAAGGTVRGMEVDEDGRVLVEARVIIPWSWPVRIVAVHGEYRLYEAQELRVMSYALERDLGPGPYEPVIDETRPRSIGRFAAAEGPGGALVVAQVHQSVAGGGGLVAADGLAPKGTSDVSRAGKRQLAPDIAAGDDGILVVWNEVEAGAVRGTFSGAHGAEARLQLGTLWWYVEPSVAAQGRTYLVAWVGMNNAVSARLVRDGAPVGEEIVFVDASGDRVDVATDGRDFVVTWATRSGIRVARISEDGAILGSTEVLHDATRFLYDRPVIACDRGECLVVWRHVLPKTVPCGRSSCITVSYNVVASRFDAGLVRRDASPLVLSGVVQNLTGLAVAAGDGEYVVAWQDGTGVTVRPLFGEPVLVAGGNPALARHGRGWLLLREAGEDLAVLELSARGVREERLLVGDGQRRAAPALAPHGAAIVAAYERSTRGEAAGGVLRVYSTAIAPAAPRRRAARH